MARFANPNGAMDRMTGRFPAWMGVGRAAALTLALLSPVAAPMVARAQFSDNYNFLKAVKDADGQKVTDLIQKPGSTVINSRSEEHTSELQSLMRNSYAVF